MDETAVGRFVHWLATAVAIAGGTILVVLTIVTVASVIGRALIPLGLSAVSGDYEIVQTGVMFAIFCALPYTHLTHSHAIVSVLTDKFSARFNVVTELIMDVLMLAAAIFVGWRFWLGTLDKLGNRETTFILHMPVWWSYAAGMLGAAALLIVSVYVVVRSFLVAISPNPPMPEPGVF